MEIERRRLLSGLGEHPEERVGLGKWLTLPEVSELVRRAALEFGLVPRAELKCEDVPNGGQRPRIDWTWWRQGTAHRLAKGIAAKAPVALIEIEGWNVSENYLKGDLKKFRSWKLKAPNALFAVVLFHTANDFVHKGQKTRSTETMVRKALAEIGPLVLTDEELMVGDGLAQLREAVGTIVGKGPR